MTKYKTIIKPRKGWRFIDWGELFRYKDLFYFLTIRGIKAKYAQSILGVGWAIIQPLVSVFVLTVIFGKLAKMDSEGFPYELFSMAAIVPWTYFSNTLNDSSSSLLVNTNLITKVYFPRLILPTAAAFSKLIDFSISLVILIVFLMFYGIYPNYNIVFLPLLILIMILTATGIGMWLSALAVQYRDVKHAINFGIQFLLWTAPVAYPIGKIPQEFRWLYDLNPMVGVVEGFRAALLGGGPMPWLLIAKGAVVALILAFVGSMYFRRMERIFADVA